MNKVKVLAISLVISIMLMGVGYAAWTSTSNVTTNASTGNFSVSIEPDISGKVTYKSDTLLTEGYEDNHYADVEYGNFSNSTGSGSIIFKDLYPGSAAIAGIKVTNNSSLPIKYDTVTYSITSGTYTNSLLSSGMIKIYVTINQKEYELKYDSNSISLTNNNDIGTDNGQNISYIKIKVVVPKELTDNLGSGLQIQLTPTFKQYNS